MWCAPISVKKKKKKTPFASLHVALHTHVVCFWWLNTKCFDATKMWRIQFISSSNIPDSCKLHLLCHIGAWAHLKWRIQMFIWMSYYVWYPDVKTFDDPPDSSLVSTCLLCQCTGPWMSALQGPALHALGQKTVRYCVLPKNGDAEESQHTFGSTMLTMTSWYARSLKACATVWSTLIVSGWQQFSITVSGQSRQF